MLPPQACCGPSPSRCCSKVCNNPTLTLDPDSDPDPDPSPDLRRRRLLFRHRHLQGVWPLPLPLPLPLALTLTLTLNADPSPDLTLKEYHIMNDPSASGKHDFMLRTALWELSQCFSGGMGWVAALYLMMTSLAPRTTAWSKVPLFGARHVAGGPPACSGLLVPKGEPPPRYAARRAVQVADCAALTTL